MEAGRRRYAAFTNREARYQFVAKVLAESGLDVNWQKKLLLPYAATNLYLTPVLNRPGRWWTGIRCSSPCRTVTRSSRPAIPFCGVVGFGRGASDVYQTNALLVKEGWMTYRTESNEVRWVEALSDVALTAAETAVLDRAAAAFQRRAALLTQALAALQKKPPPGQPTPKAQAKREFEDFKGQGGGDLAVYGIPAGQGLPGRERDRQRREARFALDEQSSPRRVGRCKHLPRGPEQFQGQIGRCCPWGASCWRRA